MGSGEGKGWSRGRTAATDARIARAAAAHRGMTYMHRVPEAEDRRHRSAGARTLPLDWSPTMAYLVGLMATDGCLISDRRHLNFKSEDEQLVRTFLRCLGREPVYQRAIGRTGNIHYVAQFSDVRFWRWLGSIGLMPRKSLVLGPLSIPDELIFDCARGLLDGDGSIKHYWYDGGGKAAGHRYEAIATCFVSASRPHLEWLRDALCRLAGITGGLCLSDRESGCWALRYSIGESTRLLPLLYRSPEVPKLERKWATWSAYAITHGHPRTLSELTRVLCENAPLYAA